MTDQREAARKSIGSRRSPDSAEAILAAAEGLLVDEGYSGFSIEAVAQRARAGKATIYRWWPSKAALLLDVYQRQKRDVEYPDTGDLEEDLFRFLHSLLRHWRETSSGNTFRSLIAEAQANEKARLALADYARERREEIGEMVQRAKSRGDAREDVEPIVVADLLASYAWVHLLIDRLGEPQEEIRRTVRHVLRGVLHQP
ncbi:TetR family transcriptional regulator [Sphingomonas oleivorans]|uniref:TetR family transcriptional regulator n=1 Tax=Sphingomonas oleivorans TaxID=1735121 RepID=A0A2T5FZA7_9SPHN|nr:TetR/AcrR family transcriptional regulator [Sphingomonas oleivorans]PTQ12041.1 TetR family transcriptional regulator [Sphingomonas oleivorans]